MYIGKRHASRCACHTYRKFAWSGANLLTWPRCLVNSFNYRKKTRARSENATPYLCKGDTAKTSTDEVPIITTLCKSSNFRGNLSSCIFPLNRSPFVFFLSQGLENLHPIIEISTFVQRLSAATQIREQASIATTTTKNI